MKNMQLLPNLQNVSIAKDLIQLSPNNVPSINKNKKSSHSNTHQLFLFQKLAKVYLTNQFLMLQYRGKLQPQLLPKQTIPLNNSSLLNQIYLSQN